MESYFECSKESLKLDYPFRLIIIGPMNSGKSTFMLNYIKHLTELVNVKDDKQTEVIIISEIQSTISELERICRDNKYGFRNMKGIPSWDALSSESSNSTHKIIIFEDCSVDLNASNQANIKNFLFQSRHNNFSMVLLTHNTNHAYAKKDSFERCFLQNASAFAFTLGHFSDTRLITNFMKDFLDFSVSDTKQVIKMAHEVMDFPIVYVSNKQFRNVNEGS